MAPPWGINLALDKSRIKLDHAPNSESLGVLFISVTQFLAKWFASLTVLTTTWSLAMGVRIVSPSDNFGWSVNRMNLSGFYGSRNNDLKPHGIRMLPGYSDRLGSTDLDMFFIILPEHDHFIIINSHASGQQGLPGVSREFPHPLVVNNKIFSLRKYEHSIEVT